MILAVALDEKLRRTFFTPLQWEQLCSLAEVRVIPHPDDVTDPANAPSLGEAEGLMTGWGCPPMTSAVLDACPKLKVIVHTGGSVRSFISDEVFARGILVASQTELNAEPVAQFCLAQILLAAKSVGRATREYARTKSMTTFDDVWADGIGVYGARVGLIGYGRVAHRLIEMLRGFSMRILLNSPYVTSGDAAGLGVELATMEEIMSTCDVISIHLGDTPNNHGAISGELLSLVKEGATFINTARGIVVDEPGLIRELRTGRFDAVLDVTFPEVPAPDSDLWALPNVTLTPHWAGSLGRELTRLGQGAITNVEEYLSGSPLTGQIDPDLAAYIA